MIDIYRNYYGLTGEPFRLGPDYRFSLHHESYANAKAYLEYAIYQGEGFIAITGEPGTGKTTLINEVLASLDRDRVEVATLTSTQLESRDLLFMVVSSFDLHPEDVSKGNLLVEIESFLVHKIRDGRRAILIVDEAQSLSRGALEELRLLANLQYQYQLLLQIFLVGQEQLLELIRAPEMEHLHQRLVAAASLEPLSLDETIDYVEHRLTKVGWKGDPAIDESALREIYRYSGGVPRRINLIANRLFLYGGMEEKHRFDADDTRKVLEGLIEEFLLAPTPPIAEPEMVAVSNSGDRVRPCSLPRDYPPSARRESGIPGQGCAESGPGENSSASPAQRHAPRSTEPKRGDVPRPSPVNKSSEAPYGKFRVDAKTESDSRHHPPSPARVRKKNMVEMDRPVPPKPALGSFRKQKKKSSNKGIVVAIFLLVGAGVGYVLRQESSDQSQVYKPTPQIAEPTLQIPPTLEKKVENGGNQPATELPAEDKQAGIIPKPINESEPDMQGVPEAADQGRIIRKPLPALAEAADELEPASLAAKRAKMNTVEPVIQTTPPLPSTAVETVPESLESNKTAPVPDATRQPDESAQVDKVVQPVVPEKRSDKVEIKAAAKPAKSVERFASTEAVEARPDASSIETRRLDLKQAAEQRFLARRAQVQTGTEPVNKRSEKQIVKKPTKETTRIATIKKPVPAKKEQRYTPGKIIGTLMNGRWSSRGKPASLLPSESTSCNKQAGKINCLSVPQKVKTKYGPAQYKVETTLSGFSPQGHFEVSYRTLVRLVGSEAAERNEKRALSDSSNWQITAYSMSCKLLRKDRVTCLDGKGVSREYRESGLGKR